MENIFNFVEPKQGILLIKGDSNKVVPYLVKRMGAGFADIVLTDPPYGCTLNNNNYFFNKKIFAFTKEQLRLLTLTSIKENGAILMFGESDASVRTCISLLELFKYFYAIDTHKKRGHLNCGRRPMLQHALVSVFYKKQPTYNPQNNSELLISGGAASDMLKYEEGKKYIYPHERSVDVLSHFIKTYTNEGELVFDFCMGAGSCAEACYKTGRKFIGIEFDEETYNKALNRIKAL
jgi:site-specific DNA-methyltransferase (adenine-specific)